MYADLFEMASIIFALILFWPVGLWLLLIRIGRDKLVRLKIGQSLVIAGIAFLIFGGLIAANAIGSDDDAGGRVVSFTLSFGLSRRLHLMRSTASDDSKSLTHFTPGRVKTSNWSLIFTPGVSTGPTFTNKVST